MDEGVLRRSAARLHRPNTQAAGEFAGRIGTPERTCSLSSDRHLPFRHAGSRVGWPAGQARRNAHATHPRADTHSQIRWGREWVFRPCRHAGTRRLRIRVLTLTSRIRRGREWVCRPGRHAGTRRRHNRGPGLSIEMHWIASGFIGPISARERAHCTIAGSHSPLKYTGLRVPATPVVHARSGLADRPRWRPHRRKPQPFE